MFFVKIENPINLKGENQIMYHHIHKEYGIDFGVHYVKNGRIQGRNGSARYWEYQEICKKIPTFKGYSTLEVEEEEGKAFVTLDLFWEDGLLLQPDMKVELIEGNIIPESDGGGVLLLCKDDERHFQVRVTGTKPNS